MLVTGTIEAPEEVFDDAIKHLVDDGRQKRSRLLLIKPLDW